MECQRTRLKLFEFCKIKFNVIKRARLGKQFEKMSFKDVRNTLVMAYDDGFLDDEEFLFLYDYYEAANLSYPYWKFDPFCLDSFNLCEATLEWPKTMF